MDRKSFLAWTDYPIPELGDRNDRPAPVRPCRVFKYDGDKYLNIDVLGFRKTIKKGYIYQDAGRYGDVKSYSHDSLCSHFGIKL